MGLFGKKPREAKAPETTAAPAAPRRRRALLVDDDLTVNELNEAVFVGRAWDVHRAYNGLGALTAVNNQRPDLVLLDLMLPDIPGEKVLDSIKRVRMPTKVIVVTGRFVTQRDFEPWEGTVVWVLRKPYAMGDLKALIDWVESGAEIRPKLSQVGDV